ncbi:MAG: ABC transporter ATP-binding protein [Deltaproteobacteria bacterium]|nr:ABC transporter ATP-binding protein [Deltaproteobacteria bacterium]
MIKLSHINYRYEETPAAWVLDGIDILIEKGEYVLLCGASGSGKSTIGYLLNGLIPHFFGGILQGTVSVLGQDTNDLSIADLLSKVGLVFQNADAQLFNSTVESEIAFGLESLGCSAQEIEMEITRTTEALGIGHLLDRPPTALSGGEKRLVTIASILCLRPPIIVLDEPLAHLDWEGEKRIRTVLRNLHHHGTTVLVTEQHVGALLSDVTRCLVLDEGRLLFDGPVDDARPVLVEQHLLPDYPLGSKTPKRKEQPLLQVKEISHEMDIGPVLHHVSLAVMEGEILAVVGRNGSGKTTLIKHFNGLLRPSKGELLFMGKRIRGRAPPEIAAQIAISFQNPNDQFFRNTVEEELRVGLRRVKGADDGLQELCRRFHLHGLLDASPYRLSEGQKKGLPSHPCSPCVRGCWSSMNPPWGRMAVFLRPWPGFCFPSGKAG